MVLTIELSEEAAASVRAAAAAQGMDVITFATAAIVDAADAALVVAGREAIKAAREGRLLAQEQVDAQVFAALDAAANRT